MPYGDIEAVRAAIGPKTAGILIEPVQGEGGIHIAAAEFLRALRARCVMRRICCCCLMRFSAGWDGQGIWRAEEPGAGDSAGWGELGERDREGVSVGGFWASSKRGFCDLLGPGTHGTTYGESGGLSAGLKVLEIIERDNLMENALARGQQLSEALKALPKSRVAAVRVPGLMVGIELAEGLAALDAVKALMADGLLTIPAGERVVRLCRR